MSDSKTGTKLKKSRIIRNNAYAVKTVWQISKSRVIHTAISSACGYFEWIFYSIFFIRFVINAIISEAEFGDIMVFVGMCFAVFCVKSLYDSYVSSKVLPFTDNKIYRRLYNKLYAKARNVELRCYEDADFYSRYTMALENSSNNMTAAVGCFFAIIFGIAAEAVAFTAVFFIDPYAILFVISPIIGSFILGNIMGSIYNKRYAENIKPSRAGGYVGRVMHLAEFAKEVRCSNIYDVMMRRYDNSIKEIRKTFDRHGKKAVIIMTLQNITSYTVIFEGIMLYAAYRTIISQTMSLAELAVTFSAMVPCSWILTGIADNITAALRNGQFLEYFRGFMEYKEAIPENQDGILPSSSVTSIEFVNVSFAYKKGDNIIENLSFKIDGSKTIAFVGHNGAGKTTIMKLLFRLYDPSGGEILVNGINIKQYNLKAYRNLFAAAFQDYKIMSMSVSDNILMGAGEASDGIVEDSLKRAGIYDKIERLPDKLHTTLTKEFDENGVVLSGGEVQKIVVARAFAKDSPVKVFDEPSSALDPIAEYELYKSIMELRRKQDITLFISHRLSSVKDADYVYMLDSGAIIEHGTHCELIAAGGAYCEMFNMQAQNYLAAEDYRAAV